MINIVRNKKILFFSPHPDDDVFSSGALISALVKKGNQVVCVYLTFSPRGVARNISKGEKIEIRKKEAEEACKIMGAKPIFLGLDKPSLKYNQENVKIIINLFQKEKPEIIFLPSRNDTHPTHQKANKLILKAVAAEKVKEKWFYETWAPLAKPNFIFFFGEKLMKIKVKAMKKHQSQIERLDFIEAVIGLNVFRGIMGRELLGGFGKRYKNKKRYGEAFLAVKN